MSAYKEKMIDAVKRGYEGLCDELGEKAQSINIKGNYLNIPFMPDYTFATDDLDFLSDPLSSNPPPKPAVVSSDPFGGSSA